MSISQSGQDHLLEQLPEEFAVRIGRGERPSLKEYTDNDAEGGRPAWMSRGPLEATAS
jgi:hypothetical protein